MPRGLRSSIMVDSRSDYDWKKGAITKTRQASQGASKPSPLARQTTTKRSPVRSYLYISHTQRPTF